MVKRLINVLVEIHILKLFHPKVTLGVILGKKKVIL
jgi:hypothetical protein